MCSNSGPPAKKVQNVDFRPFLTTFSIWQKMQKGKG
jgi:hypothetical protein